MQTDLNNAIDDVLGLKDLRPSVHVNKVMSRLVDSVLQMSEIDETLLGEQINSSRIRNISAEAESELEKFWARLITDSSHPHEVLASFPYLGNYGELTVRELGLVAKSGLETSNIRKVLVIGSGPLPLSAYELHKQSGARVDHVDSSREAMELCEKVGRSLAIESKYYEGYGEDVQLDDTYDLILIAALAGKSKNDKQAILDNILPHLSDQGRIIMRSAHGSRSLLYPVVEPNEMTGVTLLSEYHPTDYIINSVLVYGK